MRCDLVAAFAASCCCCWLFFCFLLFAWMRGDGKRMNLEYYSWTGGRAAKPPFRRGSRVDDPIRRC
ncbi:hypothetical protein M440DRAFT_1406431 [Trichoderma longibrachiatum ATCC 18648]|uniref:Uncharacterized protein n=1 Tax=Trichoderma longibrachiatum ATCC 18648 TaxID=983965 RepID=A0A2T4BQS3_TRILO|nr:hypothetical protein M440DRAFT_1406431 [Trichoderma longibrachiatum ATCC 18648]